MPSVNLDGDGYRVVYADPPWSYRDRNKRHGGAVVHYQTMDVNQIAALPIAGIVAPDAMLFMWATFPTLPDALKVIDAWGFRYVTAAFTWLKTYKEGGKLVVGVGHYTRANSEVCLLGVRGRPAVVSHSVQSAIITPRGRHSEKPAEVRDRIVELCGDVPRIELFARQVAPGWDAWGNEI